MVDANFHAKSKDRGLDDVILSPGWAYYVEASKYTAHADACDSRKEEVCSSEDSNATRLNTYLHQNNTCSAEHKAILNADRRREGYLASGVGAVLCARHALVRKNGAGDLPKGEGCVLHATHCTVHADCFNLFAATLTWTTLSYAL